MVMKIRKRARGLRPGVLLLWLFVAGIFLVGMGSTSLPAAAVPEGTATTVTNPTPVFAYYYIWFDSNSWNRAKSDYPSLGHYTSDDRAVMRQHILWAKSAGINGFIVSWKSTPVLNRRLDQLVQVAGEENFNLAIIYEGLDFNRNPLPVSQITTDLDYFISNFSSKQPFQKFSKPLVILSGTWKYTPDQISQITKTRRNSILILASERNLKGYQALSNLVDGDAYYWSSVNPDTYNGYQDKLSSMSAEVHKNGGLWIAPAAPGFDATMIGGTSTVDRKNGDTFRTQINTAMASSPDILGIISWNEFSENSYIEPSEKYGSQYLDILSQIDHMPLPNIGSFDSSEPSAAAYPEVVPDSRYIALGGFALLLVAGIVVIARRRSGSSKQSGKR
jgi:hypothetical protein